MKKFFMRALITKKNKNLISLNINMQFYVEEMTSSHPDFEILSRPVPISKEKYLQK